MCSGTQPNSGRNGGNRYPITQAIVPAFVLFTFLPSSPGGFQESGGRKGEREDPPQPGGETRRSRFSAPEQGLRQK